MKKTLREICFFVVSFSIPFLFWLAFMEKVTLYDGSGRPLAFWDWTYWIAPVSLFLCLVYISRIYVFWHKKTRKGIVFSDFFRYINSLGWEKTDVKHMIIFMVMLLISSFTICYVANNHARVRVEIEYMPEIKFDFYTSKDLGSISHNLERIYFYGVGVDR